MRFDKNGLSATAGAVGEVGFLSAFLILVFIGSLFVGSSCLFLARLPLSGYVFYLSILIALASAAQLSRKRFTGKVFAWALATVSVAFVASLVLSTVFFDVSWDGQTYHQEAVIQLANGWNPVYERLHPKDPSEGYLFLWNQCYPKAPEIAEACLYKVTGRIESGKAFNLLLIFASFCLTLASLSLIKKMVLRQAALLSALAALNPIAVAQSLTFYVDGQLASSALCLLSGLFIFYSSPDRAVGLMLALTGLYFVNIKFTAVIYFIILMAGFLFIAVIERKPKLPGKALRILTLTLMLGIPVFGYSPYATNLTEHGHMFYPVMGSSTETLGVERNQPKNYDFNKSGTPRKLLLSLISSSTIEKHIKIKPPFTFSKKEILSSFYPDLRLGGFGPLFSGILLLSLILLASGLSNWKENRTLYMFILFTLFSVLINPEAWWARYVPQFWYLPVAAVAFIRSGKKGPDLRLCSAALTLAIFLNVSMIGSAYVYTQAKASRWVYGQLESLAGREMPLKVEFLRFRPNRARLLERHLEYVEVHDVPKAHSIALYNSETKIQS